jgi:hypothetical protein
MPPGVRMSVSCECCVSSGRGLYDGPITRPEESFREWCVLEPSTLRRPTPTGAVEPRNKRELGRGIL